MTFDPGNVPDLFLGKGPLLSINATKIGCPECDLLIAQPTLTPGQRAACPRCGFVLSVCYAEPFNRALAFAVSGLMFLLVAISFPFLTINAAGVESSMTLIQTVSYLADYGANSVAVLIFAIVILIPAVMLVATVLLTITMSGGRFPDWMLPCMRWLFHINAWAMVEVFSIAVIVSLVKIAAMARVDLGLSFWAFLAFTAFFLLAFSSMDRLTVWSTVDRLRRAR